MEFLTELQELVNLQNRLENKLRQLQTKMKSGVASKKERQTYKSIKGQITSLQTKAKTYRVQISRAKTEAYRIRQVTNFGNYNASPERIRITTPLDSMFNLGTATSIWNVIKTMPEGPEYWLDIVSKHQRHYGEGTEREWINSYFNNTSLLYEDEGLGFITNTNRGSEILRYWEEDVQQDERRNQSY